MFVVYAVFFFLVTAATISPVLSYNIVAVFPHPRRSHHVVTNSFMLGLAERGHRVTIYAKFSVELPPLVPKNLVYVDISECNVRPITRNRKSLSISSRISAWNDPFVAVFDFVRSATVNESGIRECAPLVELWQTNSKYDAFVTEAFATDAMLMFAHKLGVPAIMVSPTSLSSWTTEFFANSLNPSYIPHRMSHGFRTPMTYSERLQNTVFYLISTLTYRLVTANQEDETIRRFLGAAAPSLLDMLRNVSLVLVNDHETLHSVAPKVPNIVSVGGIHIKTSETLPKDIEKFINESTHGVVYFCMGSILRGETFPEEKRNAFLKAFVRLPQRVLWKWEGDSLPGQSDKIMIAKWMPQRDILAHPNVKLFISHGGLLGTSEAIYEGVPILGIPVFGDQRSNIKRIEANGAGELLDYSEISEEVVYEKVSKLLNDPRYKKNAVDLSVRYKDRPMSPADTAVYWTEYVIRHRGAHHLKTAAVYMPWYQYLLLDVLAFLVLVVVSAFAIVYYTLRSIYRFFTPLKKVKTN